MATDPSLSDSNLPESSSQLGWQDYTGSKGVLDKDITWLRDAFIKHLGQDYWNSRNEYPHPNQQVNLLYFMEGRARIGPDGIQFIQDQSSAAPSISVVSDQFYDDPSAALPNFILEPFVYANSLPNTLSLGLNTGGAGFWGLDIEADGVADYLTIQAGPSAYIKWDDTIGLWTIFPGVTSPIIVLPSLDLPYVSVAVNTLSTSTNCFIDVDAAGANRTITLPSAATLTSGFTYVIRKLDSSNNTVIVDPNSTQTIDGVTTYTLTKQYETLTIVSNGTNWDIWGAYNNQLYVAQTATFTVGPRDTTISVSTAAGAVTANLPTAVGIAGREITIKKTTNDANFLTLDGSGSETIEGVSTYIITSIGEVTIYSNGANWLVKSESFGGYITRTTTYTTTITDRKVTANASGGAFTITLIAASSVAGERVMFRKIGTDTNLVTLDANSSETIDGAATLGLMTPGEWAELLSDGTNWLIVGYGS